MTEDEIERRVEATAWTAAAAVLIVLLSLAGGAAARWLEQPQPPGPTD